MSLAVIPPAVSWSLYAKGCGDRPMGSPEECILDFALRPSAWPEEVDFWLCLSSPARYVLWDEDRNPVNCGLSVGCVRYLMQTDVNFPVWLDRVDFYFLARLIDQLIARRAFVVSTGGEMHRVADLRLPSDEWVGVGKVRRRDEWQLRETWGCVSAEAIAVLGVDLDEVSLGGKAAS